MNYFYHLLVYLDIYLILALSLELIVGRCGLLTVAHAGYYAVGAYAYAIVSVRLGFGILTGCLFGCLVAAVLSLAVSLPSWRLSGDFFFLVSLAVQAVIYSGLENWSEPNAPVGSLHNLTNGPFGISMIPQPTLGGRNIGDPLEFTILATIVAFVSAGIILLLESSPWGRVLIAMRDDELATRSLGKNTRLIKVQAFALSAVFAAVAGVIYVAHIRYIDPASATLDESIYMLSMVIVGGIGRFRGPVVGAALLVIVPEALRSFLPEVLASNVRLMIYGLLLVLFMQYRPQGLAGRQQAPSSRTAFDGI